MKNAQKIGGALAAGLLTMALVFTVRCVTRTEAALPEEPAAQVVTESPKPMMAAVATVDVKLAPALTPTPEPTPEPSPAPEPELDEDKVEMLACGIYSEAGGDACSDKCRKYVGDVMLNRVNDPRFPDTLEEVLTAELQYGRWHWTGVVWPERATEPGEAAAVERAYRIARELLAGEHSEIYGAGYVWQAEFEQGTDIIVLDGIYFGR